MKFLLSIVIILAGLSACQKKPATEVTPWGATVNVDAYSDDTQEDTIANNENTLSEIQQSGELIMLTLSGPETYYEYHGKGLGVQYLLCEKLAEHLSVTVRVDICKDTIDLLHRLRNGEGDIIAMPVSRNQQVGFICVADNWLVNKKSQELAKAVRAWYKPTMIAEVKKQQDYLLSSGSVTRHVYPSMLSAQSGQISQYDHLFRKYAPTAGLDWVLIAAQCYQESCFDTRAHSWAGACGLMQIIPSTADHLSLPRNKLYEPEPNISAAARYMRELQGLFSDVTNPQERIKFALAAYNGGYHHVRDAMALTKKHGGIWQRWSDVRHYILALSQPQYYRDPVVNNGYMRGSETANYVDMIMERWSQYRYALRTGTKINSSVRPKHNASSTPSSYTSPILDAAPHRASKKNKWRKEE